MTRFPALRWFWRCYIPLAGLVLLGFLAVPLGPMLEARLYPVRIDQSVEDLQRTADRLCWTWVSVKARNAVSDNMDVFLDDLTDGDRQVLAIFERESGMPWARSRAVAIGPHRQSYCVLLPPSVKPSHRIRLEQTAFYPGWHGLWHVALSLPTIDVPGEAP